MNEEKYPPNYFEPICLPLTKRILFFGYPPMALGLIAVAFQQLLIHRLWFVFPFLLLFIWGVRFLYKEDPWAVSGWVIHMSMTLNDRTKMEG